MPTAVFPVGLGHQTVASKLGQDFLESSLELLLRGIWGQCGVEGGMLGARGWGENGPCWRGLLKTYIIIHGCNNLTLGS